MCPFLETGQCSKCPYIAYLPWTYFKVSSSVPRLGTHSVQVGAVLSTSDSQIGRSTSSLWFLDLVCPTLITARLAILCETEISCRLGANLLRVEDSPAWEMDDHPVYHCIRESNVWSTDLIVFSLIEFVFLQFSLMQTGASWAITISVRCLLSACGLAARL